MASTRISAAAKAYRAQRELLARKRVAVRTGAALRGRRTRARQEWLRDAVLVLSTWLEGQLERQVLRGALSQTLRRLRTAACVLEGGARGLRDRRVLRAAATVARMSPQVEMRLRLTRPPLASADTLGRNVLRLLRRGPPQIRASLFQLTLALDSRGVGPGATRKGKKRQFFCSMTLFRGVLRQVKMVVWGWSSCCARQRGRAMSPLPTRLQH